MGVVKALGLALVGIGLALISGLTTYDQLRWTISGLWHALHF